MQYPRGLRDLVPVISRYATFPLDGASLAVAAGVKPPVLTPDQQRWADVTLALRMLRASGSGSMHVHLGPIDPVHGEINPADVTRESTAKFKLDMPVYAPVIRHLSLSDVLPRLHATGRVPGLGRLVVRYPSRRTIEQAVDFHKGLLQRVFHTYLALDNRNDERSIVSYVNGVGRMTDMDTGEVTPLYVSTSIKRLALEWQY